MADDIVIDKQLFHDRLGNFVAKWKADKRSGDAIFQGASSIATVVGKASEPGSYLKPAAFQVRPSAIPSNMTANSAFTALAVRLRVSCNTLHSHARTPSNCHNEEEGYISESELIGR